jgi:hypothetical protein
MSSVRNPQAASARSAVRSSRSFLVYGLPFSSRGLVVVPRSFHQGSKIVERDSAVDLDERPLYDVLQFGGADRSGAVEREEVTPSLRSESPTLVRTQDSKSHERLSIGVVPGA